ncbi:HepT-like ribonuclease domain-containing protein [Phytoactinopolyspora limicola]|uniref:HepT-like ribonuclease domain-containing protein n=1 Tax=Phytoactinopolyspora limicola TaxID=2715536 RepID=UPI00140ACC90|nr:HepT-like ribonuclease domain-containing protein [Phytoactinopolyspora limicola]
MTRRDQQRLNDISTAIHTIRQHLTRGGLDDGLVFDAVRVRLIEIGEAVKALPSTLLDHQPGIPWKEVAGMRDRLAHHYFDTSHAILQATVEYDLPELEEAVHDLRRHATRDS